MADERAPAENLYVGRHPLEEELKKKQEEIKKARQTYLDLVEDASKYHSYLLSLLSMYDFDEIANNGKKAGASEYSTRTVTKVFCVESEKTIETPQTEPENKYMLEKFEQYLDRLFSTIANSGDVTDVQSIKRNICENVKKQVQSIMRHCKDGYDEMFEESLRNETQHLIQQLESKDLCINELQARVSQLQQEKEELTSRIAVLESSNEVDQIREELKRKDAPARKLQKKSDNVEMSLVDDQNYLFTGFIDEETIYGEALPNSSTEISNHDGNVSNCEEFVPPLEEETTPKSILVSSKRRTRLPEIRDESQSLKPHTVSPHPRRELRVMLENFGKKIIIPD